MTQHMQLRIVKRDGSVEPFQPNKLRRCFAIGMSACRCDESMADDLVRAVALHLKDWPEERPPKSEYVFRCARTVLRETGLASVARVLEQYYHERGAFRARVTVFSETRTGRPPQPWQKGRVVRALSKRFGISRPVARALAGEIERRVLMLGYRSISTRLVNELIRNELRCWGLAPNALRVDRSQPPPSHIAAQQNEENH